MKPSNYNRLFQATDGTWLAFNGWSTALAEIEPKDLEFVRALLSDPQRAPCDTPEKREIHEGLVKGSFLIEDDFDERAALKADMLRERFRTNQLSLTIAPTLDCNFRCDYCYEEHLKITMSHPVQDALVRWVEAQVPRAGELHVTWFGGEPLLPRSYDVLVNVSRAFMELAEKNSISYGAQIVTNGYLLDREKMEQMVKLGVREVQVTLDGPEEMHDQRRILAGGQGTFKRILDNLEQVVDLARFQVRINVDRRNAMAALEVVEILKQRGLERLVRPHLAQVTFDGAACGNIVESCYSNEEFARTEVEIYREAARRGLTLSRYPARLSGAFCTADRRNGFVVAPSGTLFKCWHEVTANPDKSVGHLLDDSPTFHQINEDRWLSWDPFEKSGCSGCDVLPLCRGGCPLEGMKLDPRSQRGACEHYKYHLEPLLEVQHVYRPQKQGKPPVRGGGLESVE